MNQQLTINNKQALTSCSWLFADCLLPIGSAGGGAS